MRRCAVLLGENAGNMLCHRKVMYPLLTFPGTYLQTVRTINKLALPDWFSTATAGMQAPRAIRAGEALVA
jgi:hypothetical protein